jgi:hypothetical protein
VAVKLGDLNDSGQFSAVRSYPEGQEALIQLRDAAEVLRPILSSAKERGLDIVAKIDCEGSEYEVFESLEKADMLVDFTAFMVEWHHMVPGKSHFDLINPLLRCGFVVFDLKVGQGFFYAVKAHSKRMPRLESEVR